MEVQRGIFYLVFLNALSVSVVFLFNHKRKRSIILFLRVSQCSPCLRGFIYLISNMQNQVSKEAIFSFLSSIPISLQVPLSFLIFMGQM